MTRSGDHLKLACAQVDGLLIRPGGVRRRRVLLRDELIRGNVALVKYLPVDVPVLDVVIPR